METQQNVTGEVFVELLPYRYQIIGIESKYDLMSSKFSAISTPILFTAPRFQSTAANVIKLTTLSLLILLVKASGCWAKMVMSMRIQSPASAWSRSTVAAQGRTILLALRPVAKVSRWTSF